MADPPRPAPARPRSVLVLRGALIALAAAALAVVGLAQWNPWRFTALFPLDRVQVAISVLLLVAVLFAAAVLLSLPRAVRTATMVTLSVAAVALLCVGLPVIALTDPFAGASVRTATMAVSPDGGYEVVRSTVTSDSGKRVQLFVRSRDGLFGRQAATPIAWCPYDLFGEGTPPESVRFTSEATLALPIERGPTVVIKFDPDTLEPERTLAMCE